MGKKKKKHSSELSDKHSDFCMIMFSLSSTWDWVNCWVPLLRSHSSLLRSLFTTEVTLITTEVTLITAETHWDPGGSLQTEPLCPVKAILDRTREPGLDQVSPVPVAVETGATCVLCLSPSSDQWIITLGLVQVLFLETWPFKIHNLAQNYV